MIKPRITPKPKQKTEFELLKERIDKLESENKDIKQRITKMEKGGKE